MESRATVRKAKRRIRRHIKLNATSERPMHIARVHPTVERDVFEYKVVHHVKSLFFRRGVFNRVRLIHDYGR